MKASKTPRSGTAKTGKASAKPATTKRRGKKAAGRAGKPPPAPPPAIASDRLPPELTGDTARQVWRETEPRLRDRLNLLDIDDRILILYCNCWQLLKDCQDVLAKEGRYVTMEDTGYVSRHPAAVDEQKAIAQIRQLACELGMTPKSGRRVKVRSGDADPLKAFLET
ncbi:MAG: phage terminase small subunit P27 family [Pirellulaceae bacterium]|jgi:P27 family predicted phage terminase small subunit|nr:phage terminase small subunit P27 family [Pirellulaceae bacterium]